MANPSSFKYQVSSIPARRRAPRVAIVTDWIYGGGGERVVEELHKLYPKAPIITSYCSDDWRKRLDDKVLTGYLQYPPFRQLRKFLPPLRQRWFRRLDLSAFDLVISVTGNGEAKFVHVPNGIHASYCHTPVHYYWRHYDEYLRNPSFRPKWLVRLGLKLLVKPLRQRDFEAAQKVDYFIANSTHIQNDIKQFYKRDAVVVHPPADTLRFAQAINSILAKSTVHSRHGFITVGRQVPLKKTDIIIEACNRLKLPLTIIGHGPEHGRLKKIAGPTITFKTGVSDEQLPAELASAEAFIFASFEDFGIAPIEAMAVGTPVIAYQAGGALDYVVPGKTGEFFDKQDADSLVKALKAFDSKRYDNKLIRKHATQFSSKIFQKQITHHLKALTKA